MIEEEKATNNKKSPGISKHTLLVIYDLMHYMSLSGPRIARDNAISYLHRARPTKPRLPDCPYRAKQTQLRYFERFKQYLQRLDIPYSVEVEPQGYTSRSVLHIQSPHSAKRKIESLLDSGLEQRINAA